MKPRIKIVFSIAVIVALLAGSPLLPGNMTRVRADNGDSEPPGPEVTTNAAVTKHVTTFDNIAPALNEGDGGYVPGADEPCPAGGAIPGSDFAQWDLVGNVDNRSEERRVG